MGLIPLQAEMSPLLEHHVFSLTPLVAGSWCLLQRCMIFVETQVVSTGGGEN